MKTSYQAVVPYITKDGSEIRELMHPAVHGNRKSSFAEAMVAPGGKTLLHCHRVTEEIYHVTAGAGTMQLGAEELEIAVGDTICIPPGTSHCVTNTGEQALRILCVCAPAYGHDDTEVLE
jgi:mannose-6-phosphate isomerase-like protein (cupin superfamily)